MRLYFRDLAALGNLDIPSIMFPKIPQELEISSYIAPPICSRSLRESLFLFFPTEVYPRIPRNMQESFLKFMQRFLQEYFRIFFSSIPPNFLREFRLEMPQ